MQNQLNIGYIAFSTSNAETILYFHNGVNLNLHLTAHTEIKLDHGFK